MTDRFDEMARELLLKRYPDELGGSMFPLGGELEQAIAAALRSVDAEARLTGMCIVLAAWAEQDWDKAEEFCAYQPNWPTIAWKEVKRIAEASAPGLQKEESR